MKRLLLLILCTTTLGLVSCQKDTIIQEGPTSRTYEFQIQPNQWVLSGDGYTYSYEWRRPDVIDATTVDDEGVLVYLTHPVNSSSYIALPNTFDALAYSYELFNGGLQIDIQSSDLQADAPIRPTKPLTAKVVIIPSTYYQ